MARHLLTNEHFDKKTLADLIKLGLSQDAAKCYLILAKYGSLSAQEIGFKIGIYPNATYRLTKKLIGLRIVIKLGSYPSLFQSVPISIGLETLIQKRINEFSSFNTRIKFDTKRQTNIQIVSTQSGLKPAVLKPSGLKASGPEASGQQLS